MDIEALLVDADRRRRAALVAADVDALDDLLADDLMWTHSSGKVDGKRSFLDRIASGAVAYLALEVADDTRSGHGDIALHQGVLDGRVRTEAGERPLRNRFLSVWRRDGERLQLIAWQSTAL